MNQEGGIDDRRSEITPLYRSKCELKTSMPTFENFIQFFQNISYCKNENILSKKSFIQYSENIDNADKYIYNNQISIPKNSDSITFTSIEQMYQYIHENDSILIDEYCSILNYLPEYYIRSLNSIMNYDNYLNDWKYSSQLKNDKNLFEKYLKLMTSINELESKQENTLYYDENRKKLDSELDEIRNQAIYFLKKAAEKTSNAQIKIELALHYIKGKLLPYKLPKALDILNSIVTSDRTIQKQINEMKFKIKSSIQSASIENIYNSLPIMQKEILKNAMDGDVLSSLFVGFAFYTGFNGFPIIRSLSIQFYLQASKKSPYAMYLLGFLYYNGIIFPRSFKRARNCFKRAADDGYIKAEIIDCFIRKHICRTYLLEFNINEIMTYYLPTFKSMIPNDAFVLPQLIYYLETKSHKDELYTIELEKNNTVLHSENEDENLGMNLISIKRQFRYKKEGIKPAYSKKVLVSSSSNSPDTSNLSKEDLCNIGKSYFSGDNNCPVNYSMALDFFKLAADKGDSEAQWRYALMVENSLGTKFELKEVEHYLQESARQNNLRGKLLYALFLKDNGDNHIFERLINECCNSDSLDAIYYYAMYLETVYKKLDQSIEYYQKAADKGHLDSLIRLIYLLKHTSEKEKYEKYLNLSVSMLNESLLIKLINFYDRNEKYDQSNILIEIGIKLNYKLFNAYYADHLIYEKGLPKNIERAKKLVFLAYNNNYSSAYFERYIFIFLDIFIMNNEHQKAALFLLKHKEKFTKKYRNKFLSFYQKFDKCIAKDYFITINFCYKEYQECNSLLLDL